MSINPTASTLPRSVRKAVAAPFDAGRARADFPLLTNPSRGKPVVYLDNAATSQKPQSVIDALTRYYTEYNSNVHRGVHYLSDLATQAYEQARVKAQRFLNAAQAREIIFVRGTTEAINLVAQTYGRQNVQPGDEIVITGMEHHSNIVPWQMLCQEKGARLLVVPITDTGELRLDKYEQLLGPRTKLVSLVYVSNSLGTVNPIRAMIELAHRRKIPVLIDGAQAAPHFRIDVQEIDCDFLAFSSHKLYGPTGIGILYGKARLLEAMPPYQGGGDMISSVTFEKTTYADLPNKFEAGTPHIAGAIGLGAAIDYVQSIGLDNAAAHEAALLRYATERIQEIPGVRIIGTAQHKAAVLSFVVENPPLSALDVGTRLDQEGIAIRTGHHCCQPVMDRLGIPGTARASFALYNTIDDVDRFIAALRRIVGTATSAKDAATARTAPSQKLAAGELKFPDPGFPSPEAAAAKLAEDFELFDDRDSRSDYVLDLGKKLLPMPDFLKTEATRVHGCMSVVHLFGHKRPGTEDRLDFLADSDAHIVRGLIAILEQIYGGQRAEDILAFDIEGFFQRIGLDQFISSQRRNGLAGMVERIRAEASRLAASPEEAPLAK